MPEFRIFRTVETTYEVLADAATPREALERVLAGEYHLKIHSETDGVIRIMDASGEKRLLTLDPFAGLIAGATKWITKVAYKRYWIKGPGGRNHDIEKLEPFHLAVSHYPDADTIVAYNENNHAVIIKSADGKLHNVRDADDLPTAEESSDV